MGSTLALCRTPFQAVLLKQVLKKECAGSYDLVYLTQNDSPEDRHYFSELSSDAARSQYLYLDRYRFDVLNHVVAFLKIEPGIRSRCYSRVLVSSIDHLGFRKIAWKARNAEIVSFDDGTGHVNQEARYFLAAAEGRGRFYEVVFRVPSRIDFVKKIVRHYSIYPGYEHLMPSKILRYVELFDTYPDCTSSGGEVSFFIGQPFTEAYDNGYGKALASFVQQEKIDYYVQHPREITLINRNIKLLDKLGCIAEEAIIRATQGKKAVIYGGFSSVLINLPASKAVKVMLLSSSDPRHRHYAELGEKAGCRVVFL